MGGRGRGAARLPGETRVSSPTTSVQNGVGSGWEANASISSNGGADWALNSSTPTSPTQNGGGTDSVPNTNTSSTGGTERQLSSPCDRPAPSASYKAGSTGSDNGWSGGVADSSEDHDSQSDRPCLKCKQTGHESTKCTAKIERGSGRPMTCYKCNEEGHMAKDCDKPTDRICSNCHRTGHTIDRCFQEGGGMAGRGGEMRSRGGGMGGRGGGMGGRGGYRGGELPPRMGGGGPVVCSNCGGRGHFKANCPSPPESSNFSSSVGGYNNCSPRGGSSSYGRGGQGNGSSSRAGWNGNSSFGGGGGSSFGGGEGGAYAPTDGDERSSFSTGATCYKCTNVGHLSRDCPRNAVPPPSAPYNPRVQVTEASIENRNNSGINFANYDRIEAKVDDPKYEGKKLNTFSDAKLCDELNDIITKLRYKTPTPVQRYAIPIVLDGRDLLACAQTGSGKTAAFMFPIIEKLLRCKLELPDKNPQRPLAVIVAPTRELAIQITRDAQTYCYRTALKVVEVYGGTQKSGQMQNLLRGCHILVGTTGRLKDFIQMNVVSLENVQFLVLDEADRMLDMGFLQDIEFLNKHLLMPHRQQRQTLMFSATFPKPVQTLAKKFMTNPVHLEVGMIGAASEDVEQMVVEVGRKDKRATVKRIINNDLSVNPKARIMVFVQTKANADILASYLSEDDIKSTSIHGDRHQEQREMALADFQSGLYPVIVATSVAARGLDISGVTHVINYDLPKEIDEYVHRVGRTGRVGNKGKATSFYDPTEDFSMAADLSRVLSDSGMDVPAFLSGGGGGV